jgi:hypothetical protein
MAKNKLWLGVLVIALVFGMTVVGCEEEEEETNPPSTPTGLAGNAVSPTSIQLTWNSASNANEYWIEYKKNSHPSFTNHKEGIKSTSDTITGLVPATKYDFRVAAHNGYTSSYSSTISIETLPPAAGSVSLSYLRTEQTYISGSYGGYGYTIGIFLELSEGAYWNSNPTGDTAKPWVTVSGVTLSSWNFQANYTQLDNTLRLWYTISGQATPIAIPSGINVSIDQTKFSEMKGYTNITDSLTIGSPASASSSAWTN